MNLFEQLKGSPDNLLPRDGSVHYYGPALSLHDADLYYEALFSTIEWRNDEAVIFGKKVITKRKVAWYGDAPFSYTYSKIKKMALPWIPMLLELKAIAEGESGETYNSCLLNLYHDGSEDMAWHSDGEKDLKKNGAIGSLSFGAERRFTFRNKKTKDKVSLILEHGSLLVMNGTTQTFWQHCLPPMKRIIEPRINLTFRSIVCDNEK